MQLSHCILNVTLFFPQVPVTIASIQRIKEAGHKQPPGSALAKLHHDLNDPRGLGMFNIRAEEERERRGQQSSGSSDQQSFWGRFCTQVFIFIFIYIS